MMLPAAPGVNITSDVLSNYGSSDPVTDLWAFDTWDGTSMVSFWRISM
jgi:hypothetical protein